MPDLFVKSMKSIRDQSDRLAHSFLTNLDARAALFQEPPTGRKAGFKPNDVIGPHRQHCVRGLKSAKAKLSEGKAAIDAIKVIRGCIERGEQPPSNIPEPYAAHVRTILLGIKAGLTDGIALTAKLREATYHAEAIHKEAERAFRRFESATAIAANKHALAYLQRCNRRADKVMIAMLEQRIAKQTASHRARFPTRSPYRLAKLEGRK